MALLPLWLPSVEHFRKVERQHAVLKGAGDHDFFVLRDDGDPGVLCSARDLLHRNAPSWSDVSVIINTPDRPTVHGVGQNQSFLGIDSDLAAAESSGFGSSDHAERFCVTLGSAIEDQQAITLDDEQIMDGIDSHLRSRVSNLCIRAGKHSFRCHISIGHAVEYQHALRSAASLASVPSGTNGKEDFVMYGVCGNGAESRVTHAEDPGLRPLDNANRGFFPIDGSAECENRLAERAVHNDFVMDRIVGKTMHRPAKKRFLTFDRSDRRLILIRLPGECRNLRMGHSVRHPDLIAAFVIRQRLHFSEFQRHLVRGCAAYRAQGLDISIRVQGENDGRRVTEVGDPQFLVL